MHRRFWSGLVAASCVLGLVTEAGRGARAAEPLKIPEITFEKFKLPNGLTVITHEDHRLPLVAVDLWYHVGPLNERPGRTGFAHLFEHMMFQGSEHVGEKAHFSTLEKAGATGINGTTSFDRTNYFETVPSNRLELALWLESDRMGFLMEGLDRTKLTNQRDVVRNERRQGEGTPYDLAQEEVFHLLFPKTHPYYASVIGSHADIEAARLNDVREFHQQFYVPNNATIAVAGDFDAKQLRGLLDRYFGPIPRGAEPPKVEVETPAITQQRRSTVTDTVQLPQLQMAWLTPPLYTQGDADANFAMYALGGGKASRLQRRLVYDKQLAQDVTCYTFALKLTGLGGCTLTAKPGVKLEELEAAVWDELAKLQADGPTPEELETARNSTLTQKITELQRLGGFGGIADTLDQYDQYTGDPGFLPKDIARLEKVSNQSARDVVARYFGKNNAVVVSCVPGKKVTDDVPRSPADTDAQVKVEATYSPAFEQEQGWRKTAPPAGPAVRVSLPTPATFALPNGLKVYVVEQHQLPVFAADLVTRAGGVANTADRAGLASFTAAMMTEGTEKRTATQQANDADRIGASLASQSGQDSASASVSSLSNQRDAAMELLADAVRHPAFREGDVDRVRKQRVVELLQEADDPNLLARRIGPGLVYGEAAYGLPETGTETSLKAISAAEMKQFRTAHYGASDSALLLVGDVSQAQAKELAERYFGDWKEKPSASTTPVVAPAAPVKRLVLVDKPGSPQTALSAWGVGVKANAPNLPAVEVLDHVLGNSFGSRINMNLREEHGYTYGAFSNFQTLREGGIFFAGSLVRTDVTAPAATEMLKELHRIQTDPPTEAEVKASKDARVLSLPGRFETADATARALTGIFVYDRPLDYYAALPARYRAVTDTEVTAAARDDLHPDSLVLLAVGDRAKIEPSLKELKLPIEYRDTTGKPTK